MIKVVSGVWSVAGAGMMSVEVLLTAMLLTLTTDMAVYGKIDVLRPKPYPNWLSTFSHEDRLPALDRINTLPLCPLVILISSSTYIVLNHPDGPIIPSPKSRSIGDS